MSQFLQRAQHLMDMDRWVDAQIELGRALSEQPDDSYAYSMLALCQSHLDQHKEAITTAQKAISLEPDNPYAHYILSIVYIRANKNKQAEAAARNAIALEPYFPNAWSALGVALSMQNRWQQAIEAANEGLAIDPDHAQCHQLRAQALSFLGKTDEAREASLLAMEEDPDAASSHAHLGWIELRKGRHQDAIEHFKTALRIDPNDEYAREGMLDSLRIRFPLYRWVYQFQMLLARFPPNAQWAIWIGMYIAIRILREVGESNPALMPIILPIVILYGIFVMSTWIGEPLVNITLLMHPLGRLALPRRERTETIVIAAFLVFGIVAAIISATGVLNLWIGVGLAAVFVVLLSLSTRIKSSMPMRTGLFWGLTALGVLLTAIGVLASSVSTPAE